MSGYKIVKVPRNGAKITMDKNNVLNVPETPFFFTRLMRAEGNENVTEMGCSQFGQAIIDHME